jgi:hypothetical protein
MMWPSASDRSQAMKRGKTGRIRRVLPPRPA